MRLVSVIVGGYSIDELAWGSVSLSDADSVKGLIKLRPHFDLLYLDRDYGLLSSHTDLGEQLEVITQTYVWLDDVMAKASLSDQQARIIKRYMDGYEVAEIAEMDSQTPQNINGVLNTACRNIVNEQKRQWLIWVHKSKLETEFKECSVCGESLPEHEKFFRLTDKKKRFFRNQCLKCESSR